MTHPSQKLSVASAGYRERFCSRVIPWNWQYQDVAIPDRRSSAFVFVQFNLDNIQIILDTIAGFQLYPADL